MTFSSGKWNDFLRDQWNNLFEGQTKWPDWGTNEIIFVETNQITFLWDKWCGTNETTFLGDKQKHFLERQVRRDHLFEGQM